MSAFVESCSVIKDSVAKVSLFRGNTCTHRSFPNIRLESIRSG